MTITFYERRPATIYPQLQPSPSVPAKHKAFQFPGGEAHVVLERLYVNHVTQVAFVQGADGNDLMTLAMWADACKRERMDTILVLPYLPGARQDRGTPLGAKVYADFINSLGIDRVITIDPHSDVAPALYSNLTVVPLTALPIFETIRHDYDGVVIPDAGAIKRATAVADRMGLPTYQAGKKRDFATGKLSGFVAPQGLQSKHHYLVVDDICDGGGTFIGLADAINADYIDVSLDLWVTHGIFSKGVDALKEHYQEIYNTNSHPGYTNNPNRTGVDILPVLINYVRG